MTRNWIQLVALLAPTAVFFACSSSSGTAGSGGSTASSTTAASSTSASTTSSSSSGTGTGGSATDGGNCQSNCATANAAGYQTFQVDALTSCGCTTGAACASDCTASCSDGGPNTTPPDSACTTCISGQEAMGMTSTCLVAAAPACLANAGCMAFLGCAEACP